MFKMLRTISKNLFTKPATRKYPIEKREPFEKARGCIDADMSKCILCGICQKKCPTGAIKVDKEQKTWEIDPYKCIVCNACVEVCPKKCITSEVKYRIPEYKKSTLKRMKE